jgi:hypothetical protein
LGYNCHKSVEAGKAVTQGRITTVHSRARAGHRYATPLRPEFSMLSPPALSLSLSLGAAAPTPLTLPAFFFFFLGLLLFLFFFFLHSRPLPPFSQGYAKNCPSSSSSLSIITHQSIIIAMMMMMMMMMNQY